MARRSRPGFASDIEADVRTVARNFDVSGKVVPADALRRLIAANVSLEGASDHGVSEALYLRDPDGNDVELYCDRDETEWPRTALGTPSMETRPFDLDNTLSEPEQDQQTARAMP